MTIRFTAILTTLLALTSMAQDRKMSSVYIEVLPTKKSGMYKVGEQIEFEIKAFEGEPRGTNNAAKKAGGKLATGVKLNYLISGDGGLKTTGSIVCSGQPTKISTKMTRPGFVLLQVQEDGLKDWQYKARGGAAAEPEKIRPGVKKPADFETFWDKELKELYSRPIKTIYCEKVEHKWDKFDRHKVKISGPGHPKNGFNPYVTGYLGKPRNAKPKSHPAVVQLPGAGLRDPKLPNNLIEMGFIAFAIEVHGFDVNMDRDYYRGEGRQQYKALPDNDGATREEFLKQNYERTKILRVLQALRYLKQQPEWDGKILFACGGSQGGGLSIISASLDKGVTACMASYPGYCDQFGYVLNQHSGWPDMMRVNPSTKKRMRGKKLSPFAESTAPYYDAVNFARNMKADIVMTAGWIDTVCPPTTIYAAYNSIPKTTHKEFYYGVNVAHHSPRWDSMKFVREHIKRRNAAK